MRLKKLIFLTLMEILIVPIAGYGIDHEIFGGFTEISYIDKRIEKGLDYLYENQLPNGEFRSYLSLSPEMEYKENSSAIFDTALILHILNLVDRYQSDIIYRQHKKNIDKKNLYEMKTDAVTFLLSNKQKHGVWKFFVNDNITPPDIDTTSATFAALVESGIDISNESLDYMLNYRNPNGVFYVWINSDEWIDRFNPFYNKNIIEHCVNANTLYAYSLKQREQPGVVNYINDIIKNRSFINGSLYYPSPYVFTYFVTKAYSEGNVKELDTYIDDIKKYLLDNQNSDGGWGNDLYTALATVSLINLDYDGNVINRAIIHILKNQNKNGGWNINVMYIQPGDSVKPTNYYGSQELTTSFSIEALIKYKKIDKNNKKRYKYGK